MKTTNVENLKDGVEFERIVWAIDPFMETPKMLAQSAKAIQCALENQKSYIEPVSVLIPDQYDLNSGRFIEEIEELKIAAKEKIHKLLEGLNVKNIQPPHFLTANSHSIRGAVAKLLDYAKRSKADVIVVSTHARKGTSRILLGSFAETLILQSTLPVLISNPKFKLERQVKHILFPTDFSTKSREAFERVLGYAKSQKAKILLFHKMEYIYPELGYPFTLPTVSTQSIDSLEHQAKKIGKDWANTATKLGVRTQFHLCTARESVTPAILKAAEKLKSTGMIAMASETGPIASMLLGSVTRQVLRSANCPVLVIHPERKRPNKAAKEWEPVEAYPHLSPLLS